MGKGLSVMLNDIWRVAADHPDEVKTVAYGASGTGASIVLQNFNQLMAGLAATATLIYVCIKIYYHFKDRK